VCADTAKEGWRTIFARFTEWLRRRNDPCPRFSDSDFEKLRARLLQFKRLPERYKHNAQPYDNDHTGADRDPSQISVSRGPANFRRAERSRFFWATDNAEVCCHQF
jgi:hypothetical protein